MKIGIAKVLKTKFS